MSRISLYEIKVEGEFNNPILMSNGGHTEYTASSLDEAFDVVEKLGIISLKHMIIKKRIKEKYSN